ncbi:MAG: beta-lactamase family protein [Bacilli bacterium]|nr:beta-lactamase family protein [Bacilli bacterium]
MDFELTTKTIKECIESLKLPYFKILVKKDGKDVFTYNYEIEDFGNEQLAMYSMSKPITCVAFMQLVEKGLVSLDDDLDKYYPEYTHLFNIKTKEVIKNKIKIYNLLSMTSGLDYGLGRKAIKDLVSSNPNASTQEVCAVFGKDGILFEPGEGYQYSLSLDVVAALIEKISGERFSDYVKKNIFDRLGMNHSTFKQCSLIDSCRCEYLPNDLSLMKVNTYYHGFHPSKNYESGGAGLISTVKDYSLFADSLANNNILITEESKNKISKIIVQDTPFDESVKEYSKSSEEYGYGLAVRVRKNDSIEGIPAGEFGWDGAAGSYSLIDRKNNVSIVIGLTILNWPSYVTDLHIKIVKAIYSDFKANKNSCK